MTVLLRFPTILLTTCLCVGLTTAAAADELAGHGAGLDGMGDPVCEQETADLRLWLYSMSAEADRRLSSEPLDAQLLDPALQPMAAQIADECPAVGWALVRIGPAAGRDKVLLLAEYLPAAVQECDCQLDIASLSYLLWHVSASPRVIRREQAGVDTRFGRLDRDTRDVEHPVDQHLEQGRQERSQWDPR